MLIHGKNIIGFTLSANGKNSFRSFDILSGTERPAVFYEATDEEIDAAVTAAGNSFEKYKNTGGSEKAIFLETIANEIELLGDRLIETASSETGLPVARITGERARTIGQLRLFSTLLVKGNWVNAIIDEALPDRKPLPRSDIRQMQVGLGPVAVFGASNFPLAFSVAGGDTVSALAAGCPVVFKAHPAHPETCELVASAIITAVKKCNLPEGVFSLVHGKSITVGQKLVKHAYIKAVGFTGSFPGGKAIYDTAVRRSEPIPVYAEMSSINPVIFLPEIIEENAGVLAERFASSIVLGAGQFCTNPGIFLLLKNEVSINFIHLLRDALSLKPAVAMLTKRIEENYLTGIQEQIKISATQGLINFDSVHPLPHLIETTVKTALQEPSLLEEVFGPSSIAIVADNMGEMIDFCKKLPGQLTASVHGMPQELLQAKTLLDVLQTKAGRVVVNGFPTGVEVTHAMVHGGPYPATTDSRSTSVGTQAIYRYTRPVCFQDFPDQLLPEALQRGNPLKIMRLINGEMKENSR